MPLLTNENTDTDSDTRKCPSTTLESLS
jgi:hypothetical protein